MLCVTGAETTVAALAARLAETEERLAGDFLHEIRLDYLTEGWTGALASVLVRHGRRAILTCRPVRQGGAFAGSEHERLGLLRRCALVGCAYVDVEADVPATEAATLGVPLVRSWHLFEPVGRAQLAQAAASLFACRDAAVSKLALAVEDPSELDWLLHLPWHDARRVVIGMGVAGILSRMAYRHFGSEWTYVAAGPATAPGQLTLDDALAAGLPKPATARLLGVIGGPQVLHSKGPRIYPRLFRRLGVEAVYVPMVTRDATATFDFLRRLGAAGVSVTMPHKDAAFAFGKPDALAAAARAANTLVFQPEPFCTNTDIVGVEVPLARAWPRRGRLLVLGAGGAARAVILAAERLGFRVTVASRRDPGGVEWCPWERRTEVEAEVIVNATPLRDESVWPADLRADVVFDIAIGGGESVLLARARAAGKVVLGPEAMWVAQGAAQMSLYLEREVQEEELLSLLRET